MRILCQNDVDSMHERCLDLLWKKGMRIHHQKALKMLRDAGAEVDFEAEHVRFPEKMTESALANVAPTFTLAGRDERYDIPLPSPDGSFRVCTCTGNQRYIDPESQIHRDAVLADVEEFGRFIQILDQIDMAAYPFPTDVPSETADIHALRALFRNTAKHIEVQPFSLGSIEYLFEMALAISGSCQAFRKRPVITLIVCALSPFTFKAMDVEGVLACCRHGVPIMACSLPSAGGTSPVTTSGSVLMASAEILAMVVMSQIIEPGTPIIGCPLIFSLDMASGGILQSSVEAMLAAATASEFIKRGFRIPTAPSVLEADSHIADEQAAIEVSMASRLAAAGGAGDILLGAGGLDGLLSVSPVKLIMDDTLVRILRRIASGIEVNDETMAWEDLWGAAPGVSFIERPHTLRHCREPLRLDLLARKTFENWDSGGSKGFYVRALERYKELKKVVVPQAPSGDADREIDRIVKRADSHLARVSSQG